MWVKPRKVNEVPFVSGWSVPFGRLLRKSTKRVLSGWSVSPYRPRGLSRVSRQRFSSHDPPLPSIGSRRVRFPDVSGHIEVLRLPGTHPRSLICFASGVHATLLGSCLAACACAPGRSEGAFRARVHVQPTTRLPACSHVDVSGISQVSRQSILCLCLGPRPRPNRRSLAY